MDDLESDELVVVLLDGTAEVERGVALVDDLQVLVLQEGAHLWLPRQNLGDQLAADLFLHLNRGYDIL